VAVPDYNPHKSGKQPGWSPPETMLDWITGSDTVALLPVAIPLLGEQITIKFIIICLADELVIHIGSIVTIM
jgi:hypothetical protein